VSFLGFEGSVGLGTVVAAKACVTTAAGSGALTSVATAGDSGGGGTVVGVTAGAQAVNSITITIINENICEILFLFTFSSFL
jgi:hypothetical protein